VLKVDWFADLCAGRSIVKSMEAIGTIDKKQKEYYNKISTERITLLLDNGPAFRALVATP
jgi:hypothetical protein